MANRYWIDSSGVAGWEDGVVGVATPWASTTGGSDNVSFPVDGDSVFFDANSIAAPTGPPSGAISFARLDMTGCILDLSASLTSVITVSGPCIIRGATIFTGVISAGSSGNFGDTSTCNTTAFGAGSTITFVGNATNSTASSTATTTLIFDGNSTNSANLTAGLLTFSGTISNTGAITTTTCSVIGTLSGAGSINGAVAITAGTCTQTIIGAVTITAAGVSNSSITGNVTISGSNSTNQNLITGNCTLSSGGKNSGTVTGTITAPAASNGDGTWGYTPGALGTFGTLKLTGIPAAGGGGSGLGGNELLM